MTLANIKYTTNATPEMRTMAFKMRYAKTGVACFFLISGGDVCSRYETYRQIDCLVN